MGKKGYKIAVYISIFAIFVGLIGLFMFWRFEHKDVDVDSMVQSVQNGSALVFNEVPIKDSANDLQVLRTFVPYGYEVESNVDWTVTNYLYPAEISFCACSKDKISQLNFFSTKEYLEQLDGNVEDAFGRKLLSYDVKSYTGVQDYLLEKVKETNINASDISIVKKESFTEEEIANMKKLVDENARNIDILLSPDEEHEDEDHAYVKIEETFAEPASIIFKFYDNGKEYNQQMSTILTSIIIVRRNENGVIHRERLWKSVAVYGYKTEASKFNENDDIYKVFIENTQTDQRWLTALSRSKKKIFFDDPVDSFDIENEKKSPPEIIKKAYFDEKGEFKSSNNLMTRTMEACQFFSNGMLRFSYLGDSSLMVPEKYKKVSYNDEHNVYMGREEIGLPNVWNNMVQIT